MSRIRQTTKLSGSRSMGAAGSRSRQVRVATEVYEPSSDEDTVPPDYSDSDTFEEPEAKSVSSTNEPPAPPGSWRSMLTSLLLIGIVGGVLGRTIAGAAAFATMILLITVGGLGAACLTYWLWKVFNRMVRSRRK